MRTRRMKARKARKILRARGRTTIRGGFFLLNGTEPAIRVVGAARATIEHVVIASRPRWYQVRRWWRLARMFLAMSREAR